VTGKEEWRLPTIFCGDVIIQVSDMNDEYEDWGESFDDKESSDWEDYLGGPDDEEIESRFEREMESTREKNSERESERYDEENFEIEVSDEEIENEQASRMEEIVEWLSGSKLASKLIAKDGFFVSKGPYVRLKGGNTVDLIEWLLNEGIKGGVAVAGYSVVSSKLESGYGERLSFFRIIIDAPFSPVPIEHEEPDCDVF